MTLNDATTISSRLLSVSRDSEMDGSNMFQMMAHTAGLIGLLLVPTSGSNMGNVQLDNSIM